MYMQVYASYDTCDTHVSSSSYDEMYIYVYARLCYSGRYIQTYFVYIYTRSHAHAHVCVYVYTCHCSIVARPWQSDLSCRFHLRGPRRLLCACACVQGFWVKVESWAAAQHSTRTQAGASVLHK